MHVYWNHCQADTTKQCQKSHVEMEYNNSSKLKRELLLEVMKELEGTSGRVL